MNSVHLESRDSRYESEDDNIDVLDIMAAHLALSGFFICVFLTVVILMCLSNSYKIYDSNTPNLLHKILCNKLLCMNNLLHKILYAKHISCMNSLFMFKLTLFVV